MNTIDNENFAFFVNDLRDKNVYHERFEYLDVMFRVNRKVNFLVNHEAEILIQKTIEGGMIYTNVETQTSDCVFSIKKCSHKRKQM